MVRDTPRVVVVGVCASGKSVLVQALRRQGYNARSVAQEHSLVAGMWRAHGQPNVLICLDAEAATINARLGRGDWTDEAVAEQRRRLADARKYCDLYLPTDHLAEAEVLGHVLAFLEEGWPAQIAQPAAPPARARPVVRRRRGAG